MYFLASPDKLFVRQPVLVLCGEVGDGGECCPGSICQVEGRESTNMRPGQASLGVVYGGPICSPLGPGPQASVHRSGALFRWRHPTLFASLPSPPPTASSNDQI